jgi:hypothetical protein
MLMADLDDDEREVLTILDSLGEQLDPFDHQTVRNFLAYGEPVLAFETLCTQIGERRAHPTAEAYAAIVKIARQWGIDEAYTQHIPQPTHTKP